MRKREREEKFELGVQIWKMPRILFKACLKENEEAFCGISPLSQTDYIHL